MAITPLHGLLVLGAALVIGILWYGYAAASNFVASGRDAADTVAPEPAVTGALTAGCPP
jgi:hypothetical protein